MIIAEITSIEVMNTPMYVCMLPDWNPLILNDRALLHQA